MFNVTIVTQQIVHSVILLGS